MSCWTPSTGSMCFCSNGIVSHTPRDEGGVWVKRDHVGVYMGSIWICSEGSVESCGLRVFGRVVSVVLRLLACRNSQEACQVLSLGT